VGDPAVTTDGITSKLFGYWASHRKPFPVKIETLAKLCGSGMAASISRRS